MSYMQGHRRHTGTGCINARVNQYGLSRAPMSEATRLRIHGPLVPLNRPRRWQPPALLAALLAAILRAKAVG